MSFKGTASGYPVAVRMYSFPLSVAGKAGPTKSTATLSDGDLTE